MILGAGAFNASRSQNDLGVATLFPTRFIPPQTTDTPSSLFHHRLKAGPDEVLPPNHRPVMAGFMHARFVRRTNPNEGLIFTDGACLANGQANPRAGCGFVFRPANPSPAPATPGKRSFRLESRGPSGEPGAQTSNRAELRAVIGALQFWEWDGEGFSRMVIATDSEYVVNGATQWVQAWMGGGWLTSAREPVKNKDLWEKLIAEVRRCASNGLEVVFWRIPRELNTEADAEAKEGALKEDQERFSRIVGILV